MLKKAPSQLADAVTGGVWRRIILATVLAACPCLAGTISAADEVTETMMQAQAYDAIFLFTMYPFTSPLSVTSSVDPETGAFQYDVTPGQLVSETSNGTGDYAAGTYAWASSIQVGADTIDGQFTAQWVLDPVNVTGHFSIGPLARYFVTGTALIYTTGLTSGAVARDNGTVTLQRQILQGGIWINTDDPPYTAELISTLFDDGTWGVRAWAPNSTTYITGGMWTQLSPEPGTGFMFLAGVAACGVVCLLKARRSAAPKRYR